MTPPIVPPTDSLYKFIAISGLALTIVAIAFPLRDAAALRREYMAATEEMESSGADFVRSVEEVRDVLRAATRPTAAPATRPGPATAVARYEPRGDAYVASLRGFLRVARRADDFKVEQRYWANLAVFGLFLMAAGFALWWFRVQRHQDALLRFQVAEAEAKAKAAALGELPPPEG
ncbi:MAG: hypothetical protein JWO31_956 [Phycisphaerales bacterium]|nr:hypothetical protein [Phycisphaerales bacterium]